MRNLALGRSRPGRLLSGRQGRWLAFGAVLLIGVIGVACGGGGGTDPGTGDSALQRIRDRSLGISLDAPATWTADYAADRVTVQSGDEAGIVLTLFALDEPSNERSFRESVFQVSGAFASPEAVSIQQSRLGERDVLGVEYAARDVSLNRIFQTRQFATTDVPAFTVLVRWLSDAPPETAALVGTVLASLQLSAAAADSYGEWEAVTSSTDRALFSVTFLDHETAIATGQDGVIIRSEDGGATWEPLDIEVEGTLAGVAFDRSGKVGIAVGQFGNILRSEDSGVTWDAVRSPTERSLTGVTFMGDQTTAFVVGVFGTLLRSDDAGKTWSVVGIETEESLNGISASPDGAIVLAVGRNVRLRSTDGGDRWIVEPFDFLLASVAVHSDGFGIAVGDNGAVVRTDTGGESWAIIAFTEASLLQALAVNAERVAFAGGAGTIATSQDGLRFTEEPSPTDVQLRGAAFSPDGDRFLVGDGGVILRSVPQ